MVILQAALKATAVGTLLMLLLYALRHLLFAMHRLFCRPRMNYTDLAGFHLPSISILIPMHNEEAVAADVLEALLEADYPNDPARFEIVPINDQSTDRTGEVLDQYARRFSCIQPLHRRGGMRGKAAALSAATEIAKGEILILFDADYLPGKSLLKFLAAPFADPEVGAVMGRVVPHNAGSSLLTRLLDLERAAGYQINQQARYNLGLIAQYGGTCGGVRRSALRAVGGWNVFSLTEDTDLTLRLAIGGWKIAYVNRAECYEEVPATWDIRRKQIERWAFGHMDCLHRYLVPLLRSPNLSKWSKAEATLLLGVYLTAPVTILGWIACLGLFFSGGSFLPALTAFFLASTCYSACGNFVSFIEIGSCVLLDGTTRRVRLLPLNLANFVFSTVTVSAALAKFYNARLFGRDVPWNKTLRYRSIGCDDQSFSGEPSGDGRGLDIVRAKPALPDSPPTLKGQVAP